MNAPIPVGAVVMVGAGKLVGGESGMSETIWQAKKIRIVKPRK
jgi:hypothetical protein